jgi:hypothetical protein
MSIQTSGSAGRAAQTGAPTSMASSGVASSGTAFIGASLSNASMPASGMPPASVNTNHASVEQTLGTGFGAATSFHTRTVAFQRGAMAAMLTLYYDDRRGLKARGVPLEPPRRAISQPQAFPGLSIGCTPPAGWRADGR